MSHARAKDAPFLILTPCGVCQERLAHWGGEVQVRVAHPNDPTRWLTRRLGDVTPFYWRKAIEPFSFGALVVQCALATKQGARFYHNAVSAISP